MDSQVLYVLLVHMREPMEPQNVSIALKVQRVLLELFNQKFVLNSLTVQKVNHHVLLVHLDNLQMALAQHLAFLVHPTNSKDGGVLVIVKK